ncbi:Phosphatidylglycerol--prolipoprotein diacylglyceryl transferase [subsurface metagenome]
MFRYLLEIGNFRIPAYGLMIVIGYFTAMHLSSKLAQRKGIEPIYIQSLSVWLIIGLVIGARLWFVAEYWDYFRVNFIEIFKIWEGGMVFYGGFIGGFILGLLYLKIKRLYIPEVLDSIAPGLAVGIAIGRIGCFLNGCCFGKITNCAIGIRFPQRYLPPVYWSHLKRGFIESDSLWSLPVIPTQLISTASLLVIFGILWRIRRKVLFPGFHFSLFIGLYGSHRFVIDYFRYYEGSALVLKFLTLSQAFSILMIMVSIIFIIVGFKSKKAARSRQGY